MRIELAKRTQRRLCRREYVPVKTTFVTAEGPIVGTIWFDAEAPEDEPLIVEEVSHYSDRVYYVANEADSLSAFFDRVREGRYILIGVTPPQTSYTTT